MDLDDGDGSPLKPENRLWRRMQRIELCRHRAELAEAKAAGGSGAFRQEMAEIAQQWRELAGAWEAFEDCGEVSHSSVAAKA